ncbi:hypothetical protein [Metallibacterium sp.]
MSAPVVLLPDAGPLITLAYADALDLLFKPGGPVLLVDMVLHEVTRNQTPTSEKLSQWAAASKLPVRATQTFQHHQRALTAQAAATRTANLGEAERSGAARGRCPARGATWLVAQCAEHPYRNPAHRARGQRRDQLRRAIARAAVRPGANR